MFDFSSLLKVIRQFEKEGEKALKAEPKTVEEAVLHLTTCLVAHWMHGVEPLSSQFQKLLDLYLASLGPVERKIIKIPLHQLERVRKELHDAKVASSEEKAATA